MRHAAPEEAQRAVVEVEPQLLGGEQELRGFYAMWLPHGEQCVVEHDGLEC